MRYRWPRYINFIIFTLLGCGDLEIEPDGNSGKDFERAGAQQLFLDKLSDDYIDATAGDSTDWKYFKVHEKGYLELTIYWDNKNVGSTIDVRDRFGVLIDSRRHSPELEKDKMDLKVDPGTHFVRLNTTQGASVYTIEAVFKPFDHTPDVDTRPIDISKNHLLGDDPILDDPRPVAVGKPSRGRGRGKPPRNKPGRGVTKPPAATGGVQAKILRLSKRSGKKKGSVLTLSIGTNDGVNQGQYGTILEEGGRPLAKGKIKIYKATPTRAYATSVLPPGEIAHRRKVKVYRK